MAFEPAVGTVVMADTEPLLRVRNLGVAFAAKGSRTSVVADVDLDIGHGETVGIVGESGCGKSVSWLAVLGLLGRSARVTGEVWLDGMQLVGADDAALSKVRGRTIAMIFQDPLAALNPVRRVGVQIAEAVARHRGLEGGSVEAEVERLMDAVGIADTKRRKRQFPHQFSGGMNQRVMIAMALAGAPKLLIADELTTALDVTIQAQIVELIRETQARTGMAVVFISHDLNLVGEMSERVCVMYAGRIVEIAPAALLMQAPRHRYTEGLLAALPDLAGPVRRLAPVPGSVPRRIDATPGCAFAPRCAAALEACRQTRPHLHRLPGGETQQRVACHHPALPSIGQAAGMRPMVSA